jgi:hypothetical protein
MHKLANSRFLPRGLRLESEKRDQNRGTILISDAKTTRFLRLFGSKSASVRDD